jgi:hypothetical protein
MKRGTSRASARRKSTVMTSRSGSRVQSGSVDSTSVAPSVPPRTDLISRAAAAAIGCSVREPGGWTMDSRITPMRTPARAPGVPAIAAWLAYGVDRIDERGTVVNGSRGS